MKSLIFSLFSLIVLINLAGISTARQNVINIYRKEVFNYAVLRNQQPVVAYFTSKSCEKCQKVQEKLEAFAKKNSETMYVAILDFDKYPEYKDAFGIDTVPTTRGFYKGQMKGEVKGPKWLFVQDLAKDLLAKK